MTLISRTDDLSRFLRVLLLSTPSFLSVSQFFCNWLATSVLFTKVVFLNLLGFLVGVYFGNSGLLTIYKESLRLERKLLAEDFMRRLCELLRLEFDFIITFFVPFFTGVEVSN